MKITLYKSLSNSKEIITVDAGQTIENAFPVIDFENAAIIVNGKKENKDYVLQESDVLTIRQLPAGMTAILIVTAVVAVAAGIAGGIALYKSKKAAEEAERELEKVKKLTGKNDIDNRPFLRGATNTVATGNSQPYICGRHLFTPYLLCNPFYKLSGIDGKDQYTYTVLECGFSRQIIDTVSIDDIKIKKFNSTTPQEGDFDLDGGQVFADDGLIEIIQPTKEQIENGGGLLTALPELNYKTVSKACNDEIPRDSKVSSGEAEYLTYTLDANAKNVDVAITFPYGLYAYNDDNDKIETKVTITPQYSLDGGQSEEGWIPFAFDNNGTATNIFKKLTSKQELRYCAHKEFSIADYEELKRNGQSQILLRVRSNGNDDDRIKNDCYVLFYQSVCFDAEKSSSPAGIVDDGGAAGLVSCKIVEDRERAFCTILGLRVKATKINEDKLEKINIITQGTARTWNGTQWSAEKSATRNPAAWALEILTSDSHPASRFDDGEIDLESFGDFYDYCEEKQFYFDYVVTQNAKKSATLQAIMENCGAVLYWDMYGRLAVAIDAPQENAIAVYNPQNIMSISNKKTFGRRTDGLRIKYITSYEDNFTEETYLLMREGKTLDPDSIIKDVTATGITTHDHIVKYARRLMAVEALRPKTTTIEVGNESVYFTPYSKVLLQDDSLKIGLASTTVKETQWRGGLLKKIILNEPVEFSDKACGIIVNCYGDNRAIPVALKVGGSGKTDTLEVLTAYSAGSAATPEAGNIVSFGELDADGEFSKITAEYLISNITRSDKGFRLELANYDEAVYGTGEIPPYKSNITQKPSSSKNEIPPDYPTREEMADAVDKAAQGAEAVNELAELVTHGVRFSNIHKINPVPAATLEHSVNLDMLQQKLDEVLRTASEGIEISEEKMTIAVGDKEKDLYSMIELTKDRILEVVHDGENALNSAISQTADEILAQVDDLRGELIGLIDVQAGAVQAIVEGGGASGRMALSLELPAMIDEATYQRIKNGAGATDTNAVYGKMAGTDYYTIKGDATDVALKTLWEKLRRGGLLASQIELNADQICVYNGDQKAAAFVGGKLKADYIDVDSLATKVIELDRSGIIKSKNYNGIIGGISGGYNTFTRYGTQGFAILSNGTMDLSGNTHIGGTLNVDGNCNIRGNGEIGESMTVKGALETHGLNVEFSAGNVYLLNFKINFAMGSGGLSNSYNTVKIPISGALRLKISVTNWSGFCWNFNQRIEVYKNSRLVNILHLFDDDDVLEQADTPTKTYFEVDFNFQAGDVIGFGTIFYNGLAAAVNSFDAMSINVELAADKKNNIVAALCSLGLNTSIVSTQR